MKKKILLFSHDPGGANTVIPLVLPLQTQGYQVLLLGKGPALKKYQEFNLDGEDIGKSLSNITPQSILEFLKNMSPDFIITGTSAEDKTERFLWKAASTLNIPSFAILDGWMNYGIRFSDYSISQVDLYNKSHQHPYLPTKICIMDNLAKKEAIQEGLDSELLLVTGQPYFEFITKAKDEILKRKLSIHKDLKINPSDFLIVFASEPLSASYQTTDNYWGYTEQTIFKELHEAINKTTQELQEKKVTVIIKLHPRESLDNYDKLLSTLPINSKISIRVLKNTNISNWELMLSTDLICGMSSMFLVESFLLNKPILSIQIGLKKNNPFVLAKKGVVNSITNSDDLLRALKGLIAGNKEPKYNFERIKNPIENIILSLEKILCQN